MTNWRLILGAWLVCFAIGGTGCQAARVQQGAADIPASEDIIMLPFLNRSETPLAGESAEAIALSVLRERGLVRLKVYRAEPEPNGLPVLDDLKRLSSATEQAIERGMRYAISGSVEEWRYKSGLDGEPAVGLSLRLVDLSSGEILWSGSAARSGWSRESLSGTAQKVLEELASRMTGN